jgi:hypothetical protein
MTKKGEERKNRNWFCDLRGLLRREEKEDRKERRG